MPRREQLLLLWLAAFSTAAVLVVAVLGAGELLHLMPLLVILLPLLGGRYVGEERLVLLREAASRPARRRRPARLVLPRAPLALPRGGRLIATSLAVRPPPAPSF